MLEELIKELINTYDTNILDNQPDIVQKEFLNISLENNLKGKARATDEIVTSKQVLIQLICNHYDKSVKKPIADFIGGPKSLSIHWHPGYKKIIYIFGERHDKTMDCDTFDKDADTYPIEDYLYDLMLSTDVFLDIYFELPFPDKNNISNRYEYYELQTERLGQLFKKFINCLEYNSRHEDSCQLARSHYFDIRLISSNPLDLEESKIDIMWIFAMIIRYKRMPRGKEKAIFLIKLLQRPKIINILSELIKEDKEAIYEFMKNQLIENRYIKKELDKIVENPKLKNVIITYFSNEIRQYMSLHIDKIQELINILLNFLNGINPYNIVNDSIESLFFQMSHISTFFADSYLLARVFKDFNMSQMYEKAYKGATDQPNSAHNIIIYAGDVHAHTYRNFLFYLGFDEIDSSGINLENPDPKLYLKIPPLNCLDMRKIKQPFFSYKRYDQSTLKVIKSSKRIIIGKEKLDQSIVIDTSEDEIVCSVINEALRMRDYPYRIQHYNKPKIEDFRKIREIGILTPVLSMHHSYLVMIDITDDTFASFLQYEKIDIEGELLYHVHASGTSKKHLRKGLNIILKVALCRMGRDEHAIYVSSIKESAFSKPMMEKFGFTFHDESIIIHSKGSDYYVNVTGVLYDPEICEKVDELYNRYVT
jgi:hypothetical protein